MSGTIFASRDPLPSPLHGASSMSVTNSPVSTLVKAGDHQTAIRRGSSPRYSLPNFLTLA